jgi:hypothetical protein
MGLIKSYGRDKAVLVGFLQNFSKVAKKDELGFFGVETAWLAENLNMPKRTLLRLIREAESDRLIQYKPGKNQNSKPKFKIF